MLEKYVRNIYDYVKKQNEWRSRTINLIASENIEILYFTMLY